MDEKPVRIVGVSTSIFDEREIHLNCTVEILRNSVTGETSIGWWENDHPPVGGGCK
jgi:hypothetical protein